MAFDGCYYFIGQSRMRHWGTHHEPNLSLDSGIHVLDPVERTTRFITLPSAQVYDIAIV
jgi:hypothetical protein